MQRGLQAAGEVEVIDQVSKALRQRGDRGRGRHRGVDRRYDPVEVAAAAASRRRAALEQPIDAERNLVGQCDFGDGHLDYHLALRNVELLERRLDHRVFRGRRDDEDGVVVLVGDYLDVANHADAITAGDRPRGSRGLHLRLGHRRRVGGCRRRRRRGTGLRLERRRRNDRSRRRARRQCGRSGGRLLLDPAGESLLQQRPDAFGAAVLHLIDVEAHA